MKRFLALLTAILLVLGALPAWASAEEETEMTFEIYMGESNRLLYIGEMPTDATNVSLSIENEKNTKILSKKKTSQSETAGSLWACALVTPKKKGTCSFDFCYSYASSFGLMTENRVSVTVKVIDQPGPPEITKNPTGESVATGGSCTFVARADNADSIQWFLTNGHDTVKASKGPSRFSGLKVSGYAGEKLKLSNIPLSMDGWEAFATFTNTYGTTDSECADIEVYEIVTEVTETPQPVVTPTPTPMPATPSVILTCGEQDPVTGLCTLTASLSGCPYYTVQWYYNTKNAVAGAIPVGGNETVYGSASTLIAGFDGKTELYYYYFVKVWNALGGSPAYSKPVQVVNIPLLKAEEEEQTPAVRTTPEPVVTPAPEDAEPTPAPTPYNGTKLLASAITVKNAGGREVGLAEQEAKRVTGYLAGTYVLIDESKSTLWYTNGYGTYIAAMSEATETAEEPAAETTEEIAAGTGTEEADVTREAAKTYALTWEESPTVLSDHSVSASALTVTEQYGFISAVTLSFGLDGRTLEEPFDLSDHASGWRYSVEELFDVPIA